MSTGSLKSFMRWLTIFQCKKSPRGVPDAAGAIDNRPQPERSKDWGTTQNPYIDVRNFL